MRRDISGFRWLVYQLAAAGAPKIKIAAHLGIARNTVDLWLDSSRLKLDRQSQRESHQKHLEERKRKQKEYRDQNVEAFRARSRKYHRENKETVAIAAKNWRDRNRSKLREQSKTYYTGERLHSQITPDTAREIKALYESGASTLQIASKYGVGPKAVAGAVRWAGGEIRPKTAQGPLGDSLLSFLRGDATRDSSRPVIFYVNATAVPGAYKAGITNESWKTRALKNKCNGFVYGTLLGSWQLPSRFHGWCVEACWHLLPTPDSMNCFEGLNGRTEVRAGDETALLAMVSEWCQPFVGEKDSFESRVQCACMAALHQPKRSVLARQLREWTAANAAL
jgi:DNA-binding CsgD family transcriptional regulator